MNCNCNGTTGLFCGNRNEWLWIVIIAIVLIVLFGCCD